MANKKRIKWIDTAKAIGIFLVIWGHITSGEGAVVLSYIYVFHMPLFIFLSGLVFSGKLDFKTFIFRKFRTIYVPYAAFLLFEYGRHIFLNRNHIIYKDMVLFLGKELLGWELNSDFYLWNGPIWFLCALFFSEVLFYFIVKNKWIVILSFFIGVTGCCIVHFQCLFAVGYLFPFITFLSLGYLSKSLLLRQREETKRNKIILGTIFVIALAVLIFTTNLNPNVSVRSFTYGSIPLFLMNAVLGIIVVVSLAQLMPNISFINYIGQNTVIGLCFHLYFNRILFPFLFGLFGATALLENIGIEVLLSVAVTFCVIPLAYICNQYLYFLFGRNQPKKSIA